MLLAITADLHLDHDKPERLEQFEVLCQTVAGLEADYLVCAGDTFDLDQRCCAAFEKVLERTGVRAVLLPGNHDHWLSGGCFSSDHVLVVEQAAVVELPSADGDTTEIVALPYRENRSAGADLAELGLPKEIRLLLLHGDYGLADRSSCGGEYGYYPVTAHDLQKYRVRQAVAGHIHQPDFSADGKFLYAGSPWPVTGKETGMRRLLLWDSLQQTVTPHLLPEIFYRDSCTVTVISTGDDQEALLQGLQRAGVRLNAAADQGVLLLTVQGVVADKSSVAAVLDRLLQDSGYSSLQYDLDGLHGAVSGLSTRALSFVDQVLEQNSGAKRELLLNSGISTEEVLANVLRKMLESGVA